MIRATRVHSGLLPVLGRNGVDILLVEKLAGDFLGIPQGLLLGGYHKKIPWTWHVIYQQEPR